MCVECLYAMAEGASKCHLSRHNALCSVCEPIRQWVVILYDLGNWVQWIIKFICTLEYVY